MSQYLNFFNTDEKERDGKVNGETDENSNIVIETGESKEWPLWLQVHRNKPGSFECDSCSSITVYDIWSPPFILYPPTPCFSESG